MNIFEIIGYIAGLSVAVCFLPQSIKTIRTQKTDDISLLSYFIYNIGIICWIIYGWYLSSLQMMLFNGISLVSSVSIFIITLKNKIKQKR
ncbi:MAG: glutathione synthetase [Alphaproteobacteria bacterium]|nr:glutathione synthetase [Alphaproteobacteria bacterium]